MALQVESGVLAVPTITGNQSVTTTFNPKFVIFFSIRAKADGSVVDWHHNFGRPMSHGCVNVSYEDMEKLYNWAEEGTRIIIE